MQLGQMALAMGLASLAGLAFTPQRSTTGNSAVRLLKGSWTIDGDITARLEPDSRLAQFKTIAFTDEPDVMKRLQDTSQRLKGLNLILSGTLTMEGNNSSYVLAEKDGMTTLIWFQPATEGKVGDSNARVLNLVAAKSPNNDLLFLGAEDNARNASVCFKRADGGGGR